MINMVRCNKYLMKLCWFEEGTNQHSGSTERTLNSWLPEIFLLTIGMMASCNDDGDNADELMMMMMSTCSYFHGRADIVPTLNPFLRRPCHVPAIYHYHLPWGSSLMRRSKVRKVLWSTGQQVWAGRPTFFFHPLSLPDPVCSCRQIVKFSASQYS